MSVSYDFSGKQVWVTGAARGIGLAIANAFFESGAHVIGIDIKFNNDSADYKFQTETVDVSSNNDVKNLAQRLFNNNNQLDVLVNAAGVLRLGQTDELSVEDWQALFNVNVTGPFNMFQATMPTFRAQKHGSIVTLASNSAHAPRIGMSAYGASKSACLSLCRSVGLELAPYGVRCNVVSPGSTNTEMLRGMYADPEQGIQNTIKGFPEQYKLGVPLKKIAEPREVAAAVLFLASDAASHTILQDIVVDGGATLGA